LVVYKITNTLNGKIYIGQTQLPIEIRFMQHSYANSPLGRDMRQYGLENFTVEVIEKCATREELREREAFWIKVLKAQSPQGYNVHSGSGRIQGSGKPLGYRKPEGTRTRRTLRAYDDEWELHLAFDKILKYGDKQAAIDFVNSRSTDRQ